MPLRIRKTHRKFANNKQHGNFGSTSLRHFSLSYAHAELMGKFKSCVLEANASGVTIKVA